jgi:hypothetical protein
MQKENACRLLVWKPEGKRPLGNSVRRKEDKIDINFKELDSCGSG